MPCSSLICNSHPHLDHPELFLVLFVSLSKGLQVQMPVLQIPQPRSTGEIVL